MPAAESHSGGILRNRFSLATSASGWQGFASGAVRTSPRIGPETLRDRHRRAPRRCTYSRSRAAQHRIDRLALVGRAAAAFISGNKRRDGWSATTSSARKKKQSSIATLQRHLPRADRCRKHALSRGGDSAEGVLRSWLGDDERRIRDELDQWQLATPVPNSWTFCP